MIKGNKRSNNDDEASQEYYREELYHYNLQYFEGVDGHAYGIMDELQDLKKLIGTIGKTIEKEEQEFKQIEQEEWDDEFRELTPRILTNWHKKMYRQFSYKSLILLIHTTFENALIKFFNLLTSESRISVKVYKLGIPDIIKELKVLDPALLQLSDQVRAFNFLRNTIAHADGHFETENRDHDAFKKYIVPRADVSIKTGKGKFKNRVAIIRSTVLLSYIDLIESLFNILIKRGSDLKYLPPTQTTNTSQP